MKRLAFALIVPILALTVAAQNVNIAYRDSDVRFTENNFRNRI